MRVARSATVTAPRDAVWKVVSDPEHLPRWWPGVARVEEASADAWTKVLTSPKGRAVRADFTRAEAEAPRRLVWRQELLETPFERILSEAVTEIELEPEGEEATRVSLRALRRLRGMSRFGGFMVRRATRRQLDDALAGLERAVGRA